MLPQVERTVSFHYLPLLVALVGMGVGGSPVVSSLGKCELTKHLLCPCGFGPKPR